jgi:hypothetical protein
MSPEFPVLRASRGNSSDRRCFHRSATVTNEIPWSRFPPCIRASVVDVLLTARSTPAHDRHEVRRDFRTGRQSN